MKEVINDDFCFIILIAAIGFFGGYMFCSLRETPQEMPWNCIIYKDKLYCEGHSSIKGE